MGGRGGSSSLQISTGSNSGLWDYRGYVQRVDQIENAFLSAKTSNQKTSVYKAINSADKNISIELDRVASGGGDAGDTRVLMAQRRRLRIMKKKLVNP
jgi:hypothetical protein